MGLWGVFLMLTNLQIKILVGCVLLVLVVVSLVQGHALEPTDLVSASSYVVTALGFVLLLWDRWLWSWSVFHFWLSKRPDLRGTWKGELISDYTNSATNQRNVFLMIRQTNSTIDVRLFSAESSSVSLSGELTSDKAEVNTLIITYRNEPQLFKREHSPISYGAMLLNVRGDKVYRLDGYYWTDRSTRGEVKFTMRSKEKSHDFEQAAKLNYSSLNSPS
jgi:SMODS-associating 2TM, beta-strand rich effector domain